MDTEVYLSSQILSGLLAYSPNEGQISLSHKVRVTTAEAVPIPQMA